MQIAEATVLCLTQGASAPTCKGSYAGGGQLHVWVVIHDVSKCLRGVHQLCTPRIQRQLSNAEQGAHPQVKSRAASQSEQPMCVREQLG